MCNLCEKAKSDPSYISLMRKMRAEDEQRLENAKYFVNELPSLQRALYSSLNWPVTLCYPLFDARMAYSIPNNYYQQLLLDEERLGNNFSHGSTRSLFFSNDMLLLLSKAVNHKDGKEFFTSFVLAHFTKKEFTYKFENDNLLVSVDCEKAMKNLMSGQVEKKKIRFSFKHECVKNRIVTKEEAMSSSTIKMVYERFGGVHLILASADLVGYVVTVPHFCPHPYLLQLKETFGYASNREFQEHVLDYFKVHLEG